jgi:hypothetical protein
VKQTGAKKAWEAFVCVFIVNKGYSRNEVKTGDDMKNFRRLFSRDREGGIVKIKVMCVDEIDKDFTTEEMRRTAMRMRNIETRGVNKYRARRGEYCVLKARKLKF